VDFLKNPDAYDAACQSADRCDDIDMWINAAGKLGMVAKHAGMHVCWHCFEMIAQAEQTPGLRAIEIFPEGSEVGCYVHEKCARERITPKAFIRLGQGMGTRRDIARIMKQMGGAVTEIRERASSE